MITGTPGTGKTTLSKLLSKELKAHYIDVGKLAIEKKLLIREDLKRKTMVIDPEKTSLVLQHIIQTSKNKTLILDTHIPESVPSKLVSVVIVLRTDPYVLKKRLMDKGFNEKKIKENVQAEILGNCLSEAIILFGLERIWEINTSYLEEKDALKTALKIISEKPREKNRPGKIDWLGKLYDEKRLSDFFE